MDHSPEPKETISQFEKLLAALAVDRVDFAVVGGVAVILNGYPRLTLDVDILVHPSEENLNRLLDCLKRWGEGWAKELTIQDFSIEAGAIRVIEDFALDIFVTMGGRTLDDFRPRLLHLDTGTVRIPYLAPEDLIYLKQDSWRDKDRLDVEAMREIIARRKQG